MDILILGNGFLGARIADALVESNHDVTLFSKSIIDYTQSETLIDYMRYSNFGLAINASGYTGRPNIDACEDDKENCWKYNVIAPLQIMEACDRFNVPLAHLSSGCIYAGYDREFEEEDTPNFGLFNDESSFYSKTKHAAETLLINRNAWILRLRMPFTGEDVDRNYFNKILGYNSLISEDNSMTCVDDLCDFMVKLASRTKSVDKGIYNVVNYGAASAKEIVKMLAEAGISNPEHYFIDTDDLKTKAKRSNCVLSNSKLRRIGLELPHIKVSLAKCIDEYSKALAN